MKHLPKRVFPCPDPPPVPQSSQLQPAGRETMARRERRLEAYASSVIRRCRITICSKSRRVRARCGGPAVAGPVRVKEFAARFIDALIGVRAKIVALCLEQVRG